MGEQPVSNDQMPKGLRKALSYGKRKRSVHATHAEPRCFALRTACGVTVTQAIKHVEVNTDAEKVTCQNCLRNMRAASNSSPTSGSWAVYDYHYRRADQ